MRRTELVNMIKVVRLLAFPKLFARAYPPPKLAICLCFVTAIVERDPQPLLFF